jgi:hypothetical protein
VDYDFINFNGLWAGGYIGLAQGVRRNRRAVRLEGAGQGRRRCRNHFPIAPNASPSFLSSECRLSPASRVARALSMFPCFR